MCRARWVVRTLSLLVALVLCVDARSQDKKADPAKPAPAPPEKKQDPAPAPAEKKPEPAPATQQQERIDLGPVLDSWYKVYQKDAPAGYVHEVLQRAPAGNPWRYRYDSDSEIELLIPDEKDSKKTTAHTESMRVRATLDDTFAPVTLERADNRDESQFSSTVLAEENGWKIDVVVGSERKPFTVNRDEEVHYSRFLMFISLRQNGKLAKAGTQKALLFWPREDAQSPITEVQLEVHEFVKREYLGKKDVSVTRVTYLKPPPAPTRDDELVEAFVDKFGRVAEETTRGGARRVLVKDEIEAVGKNERVRPGARRDPFRKDLAMMHKVKGDGPGTGAATIVVDKNKIPEALKEMEKLVEDLKKAKEEKREDEGQKIYNKILDWHAAFRRANIENPLQPNDLAKVESLRKSAEEVWGGIERLMKELQGVYVKVIGHFNNDECDPMEKGISQLKKSLDRKELADQVELSKILRWIGELEPLVGKCRTRQELGKKVIRLTGTMIHEDIQMVPVDATVSFMGHTAGGQQEVRFVKPNRIAVINEKMYRVGDVVEGQGVRVEKIWAFGVQVSLREETRDVGIRQGK